MFVVDCVPALYPLTIYKTMLALPPPSVIQEECAAHAAFAHIHILGWNKVNEAKPRPQVNK